MGMFDRIVSRIWSLYPRVKDAVEKAEATVESVAEHIEEKVETTVSEIEDKVSEIADVVLSTPQSRRRTLEILAALHDEHLADNGEDLKYKTSIIDLLKLIGEDSSKSARKELAEEDFGMTDYHGTAEQNDLLVEKVMQRLDRGRIP